MPSLYHSPIYCNVPSYVHSHGTYSPTISSSTSSSSASPTTATSSTSSSMVAKMVGKIFWVIFMFVVALVGSLAGALTGALMGMITTESGPFRTAGFGAISGAVISMEAIESSCAMWHSDGMGTWSIVYMIHTISSHLSGRLAQERVGLAVQSAMESQISAMDLTFMEGLEIFETYGATGIPMDSIHRFPKMIITSENYVDASGESICCAVCLQDFQIGEMARRLPQCHHMFHLPCIDGWFLERGSCPLCRRDY